MAKKLDGKIAIVTGGADGIGGATVREFVKEGAKVVIADINEEKGMILYKELKDAGADVLFVKTNVAAESEVENLVSKTVETYGRLDVVFNNAGVAELTPTHELTEESWRRTVSVNLDGVFFMAKHAIKQMLINGGGSIVNAASIYGHVGFGQHVAYSSSKGGVVNLTRALAVEYAKENIRVNSVGPGFVMTPMLAPLSEEMLQYLATLHPIGRLGKPVEIAKAVVFLASDDASFITGANIPVDGGYIAQ